MQFLYWIEMPPSNRLGINDNEENERGPGTFNITRAPSANHSGRADFCFQK
jgi:hypothetical protein